MDCSAQTCLHWYGRRRTPPLLIAIFGCLVLLILTLLVLIIAQNNTQTGLEHARAAGEHNLWKTQAPCSRDLLNIRRQERCYPRWTPLEFNNSLLLMLHLA